MPEASYLLGRGSVTNKKEVVTLGLPPGTDSRRVRPRTTWRQGRGRAASARRRSSTARIVALGTTYQRAALAEWLTDVDHGAGGLLARVIVNRLWQHHFGEGLVRTPDDFGTHRRPTRSSRAARLAGGGAGPRRLAAEADPPADRDERGVPSGDVGRPATAAASTPRTACSGTVGRSGSRPRRSATRCSPSAAG